MLQNIFSQTITVKLRAACLFYLFFKAKYCGHFIPRVCFLLPQDIVKYHKDLDQIIFSHCTLMVLLRFESNYSVSKI